MGRTSRMLIVLFSRGVRGHSSPGKILQFGGLGIPFAANLRSGPPPFPYNPGGRGPETFL